MLIFSEGIYWQRFKIFIYSLIDPDIVFSATECDRVCVWGHQKKLTAAWDNITAEQQAAGTLQRHSGLLSGAAFEGSMSGAASLCGTPTVRLWWPLRQKITAVQLNRPYIIAVTLLRRRKHSLEYANQCPHLEFNIKKQSFHAQMLTNCHL